MGKETKDDPSKGFSTVNETERDHEVKDAVSYMMMMVRMMMVVMMMMVMMMMVMMMMVAIMVMINSNSLQWYYTESLQEDTDTQFGLTEN